MSAQAFVNPFNLDPAKSASALAGWVQRQFQNVQQTLSNISESQIATFVGDGIKAAKEASKFVKETIGEAKELITEVKKSDEYKAAMISSQIAKKTKELNSIKDKMNTELANSEAELKLEIATLEAKIEQAQNNFITGSEILAQTRQNATSQSSLSADEQIASFKAETDAVIASLETEISALKTSSESKTDEIAAQFANQTYAIGEEIYKLTQELKQTLAKQDKQQGTGSVDPEKVIEQSSDALLFKKDKPVTLQMRKNKELERNMIKSSAMLNSMNTAVKNIVAIEDVREKNNISSLSSQTLNGKSEATQTMINQTINQLDYIYLNLENELNYIYTHTANLLSQLNDYRVEELTAAIDVCRYEPKPDSAEPAAPTLGKISDLSTKINNTANQVKKISQETPDIDDIIGLDGML